MFIRVGLPYKVVGGVRFYERKEVRDALAYLRVLANPDDAVSLRRILNTPRRGIGDRAEACVEALAERERIPFAAGAAPRRRGAGHRDPRRSPRSRRFNALMDDAAHARRGGRRPGDACSRRCSSRPATSPSCRRAADPQDETRVENLARARGGRARVRGGRRPRARSRDFLERVSLVADADEIPDADEHGGVVTLMTLHTAKGLEFPVVFLTGLEDGVFPHMRSLGDAKELEEERRLAYVGITRARAAAVPDPGASCGRRGAQPSYNPPSRFLDEIPSELVDWQREDPVGRRRRRPSASPALAHVAARPGARSPRQPRPVVALDGRRPGHPRHVRARHRRVDAGAAEKAEATVDFGDHGAKRLLLRYAPVEKL